VTDVDVQGRSAAHVGAWASRTGAAPSGVSASGPRVESYAEAKAARKGGKEDAFLLRVEDGARAAAVEGGLLTRARGGPESSPGSGAQPAFLPFAAASAAAFSHSDPLREPSFSCPPFAPPLASAVPVRAPARTSPTSNTPALLPPLLDPSRARDGRTAVIAVWESGAVGPLLDGTQTE
jgi:hypothetical protein